MVKDLTDPRRSEPAYAADERAMLQGWLDYHRVTLLLKCEGLSDIQLNLRIIPTSLLSLHGLVRHMTEVEFYWTSTILTGVPTSHSYYCSEESPDADFEDLGSSDFATSCALWTQQQRQSDEVMSGYSLDQMCDAQNLDISLRWILSHLVEEYARHNGHVDLIRELLDGKVGC